MYSINRTKYLTVDERLALEQKLTTTRRNDLLIRLALATGARATELLNLTKQSMSDENQSVLIIGLKNSHDREIPLTPKLYSNLKLYASTIQSYGSDIRLFPISYSYLSKVWPKYKTGKTFHSLRHTFAIELYKRTRDIKLLQTALGHKQISNTMVYADYVFSSEELRRLIL